MLVCDPAARAPLRANGSCPDLRTIFRAVVPKCVRVCSFRRRKTVRRRTDEAVRLGENSLAVLLRTLHYYPTIIGCRVAINTSARNINIIPPIIDRTMPIVVITKCPRDLAARTPQMKPRATRGGTEAIAIHASDAATRVPIARTQAIPASDRAPEMRDVTAKQSPALFVRRT